MLSRNAIETTYPFDPYNWATITPLFETLINAPVLDGGFMSWLEEWNQLDIAVWDAYTALKRPVYYDTSDIAAEQAYGAYVQELYSTYLGHTSALIDRALALQPEPPSANYAQLWRRWHNQRDLFHPASLPIQAEISQLEVYYREIMNRCDADNPSAYWLNRRAELNELMLRLLRLRRSLAQSSGLPNFLAYRWRELNRLGYSIADCQAFHRAVEIEVIPRVAQLRAAGKTRPPAPEISNFTRMADGVERILQQVDPTFGAIFQAIRADYMDIGERPNKAVALEEWFFPRVGMPYLHVASSHLGSVLHESGHAVHDYLSFQAHRSMWNLNGPEEFQEFVAMSLAPLSWPFYGQARGGLFSAAESRRLQENILHYYLEALTDSTLQDAFEHWVYGEAPIDVTPADLDAKWLELKRRYTPWDAGDANDEAATGWQRWNFSLFRMPLYMITYPMSIVGVCQFTRLVDADRAGAIERYKAALALGNTRSLPELFATVGVTFPFTQQAMADAVRFTIEEIG